MIYGVLNLLSTDGSISFYNTMSILGYCLMPIAFLAATNVVVNMR